MTEEERQERIRQLQARRAQIKGEAPAQPPQEYASFMFPNGPSRGDPYGVEQARVRQKDQLFERLDSGQITQDQVNTALDEQSLRFPSPQWERQRNADLINYEQDPDRFLTFGTNVADSALAGLGSELHAITSGGYSQWDPVTRQVTPMTPEGRARARELAKQGADATLADMQEAHPITSLAGDVVGFSSTLGAGGYQAGNAGLRGASAVLAPRIATGTSAADKGVRYGGRLAGLAGISAADAALYGYTVDAENLEAVTGEDASTFRNALAVDYATDPLSWGVLPATSVLYRGARGLVTDGANAGARGLSKQEPFKFAGVVPSNVMSDAERAAALAPRAANEAGRLRAIGFDDAAVDDIIDAEFTVVPPSASAANKGDQALSYDPATPGGWGDVASEGPASVGTPNSRRKALRMFYKRLRNAGVSTDKIRAAVSQLYYGGYSDVPEMMFEMAGQQNDQLAVALGSIGGKAKEIAETLLPARSQGGPARIRQVLQRAMGISGGEFYDMQDDLVARRFTEPDYETPYAAQVTEETWQGTIRPLLEREPIARQAVADAIDYAAGAENAGVRRELSAIKAWLDGAPDGDELAEAFANGRVASTQALDFIDRMLGDAAEGIRKGRGRPELARAPQRVQDDLRGVQGRDQTQGGKPVYGDQGLDVDTGLNVPRDKSAEIRSAEDALQWGRKAFTQGTDLETMMRQYRDQIARYGPDNINSALLVGWMRGAEDAIEKATNPSVVIRQLYGSERQRAKLIEMLPTGKGLSSGGKSDLTKRLNVLRGNKANNQKGIFERELGYLRNQNRIVGNSQTAQRTEAIDAQGGLQNTVSRIIRFVAQAPREMLTNVAETASRRATMSGIYQREVNEELGKILFASGRDELLAILDEVDALVAGGAGRGDDVTEAASGLIRLKGQGGAKQVLTDALAIGALATAAIEPPVAEAQEAVSSGDIAKLQSELDALKSADITPQEKQRVLLNRGHNLGTTGPNGDGIDGVIGEKTRTAIQEEISKIEGEINERRMQSALEDTQPNSAMGALQQAAPWIGAGLGLLGANRYRRYNVRQSQQRANALERSVNTLAYKSAQNADLSNPQSLNESAAAVNDVYRLGGAGKNVPLVTDEATGQWMPRDDAIEVSELFRPGIIQNNPIVRNADVGAFGLSATEAALATPYVEQYKSEIEEAQAALVAATEAQDPIAMREASSRLESAQNKYALALGAQRLGMAGMAGAGLFAMKNRYATPRPMLQNVETELARVRQALPQQVALDVPQSQPSNGLAAVEGPARPALLEVSPGVLAPTDDRRLYDFENPVYRDVDFGKLAVQGKTFDEQLRDLGGMDLPISTPRPARASAATDRNLVVVAATPEESASAFGRSPTGQAPVRSPAEGTASGQRRPLELVGRQGPPAEPIRVQPGSMSSADIEAEVSRRLAAGASRVPVIIPPHRTRNGVVVEGRTLYVMRRGDLRSPDAAFNPDMRGQAGVMAGVPLAAGAGLATMQIEDPQAENMPMPPPPVMLQSLPDNEATPSRNGLSQMR